MSTLPRIPTEDIPFRLHALRSMSMAAKRAYSSTRVVSQPFDMRRVVNLAYATMSDLEADAAKEKPGWKL